MLDTAKPDTAKPDTAKPDTSNSTPVDQNSWTAVFLDEWLAKRESNVPGHELRFLHLVFEEWFPEGHVRVSVRGDGWYAVELDGISGWNPRARGAGDVRRLRGSYSAATGGFPFLQYFGEFGLHHYMTAALSHGGTRPRAYPPCPLTGDDGSGDYHASLTLVAEFRSPAVLRSWWTSPNCPGFPHQIAGAAWTLIERVTQRQIQRPGWHLTI